jgi:hypothetical protein
MRSSKWATNQIMAKTSRLDKENLLGSDIQLGLAALNVGHHFAREVHGADRVLEAVVRGAGEDIVSAAESDDERGGESTGC